MAVGIVFLLGSLGVVSYLLYRATHEEPASAAAEGESRSAMADGPRIHPAFAGRALLLDGAPDGAPPTQPTRAENPPAGRQPPIAAAPAVVNIPLPDAPAPRALVPPRLDRDVVFLDQPAPLDGVAVGGGGRYLVLHWEGRSQLGIFDVSAARVVKELALPETPVHFTAGMNDLFVALPNAHVLQRWSLDTFERTASARLPFEGAATGLCMGSASAGPLLACEQRDGSQYAAFIDASSLKRLDVPLEPWPGIVPPLVRASADGRVFAWRTSTGSEGHSMATLRLARDGTTLRESGDGNYYLLTPGPDSRYLYAIGGELDAADGHVVFPRPENNNLYHPFVPAVQGPYFLQLVSFELGGPAGRTSDGDVILYQRGSNTAVATLRDVEGVRGMDLSYGSVRTVLAYDQRILFIPAAKVLIHIPADRKKLVLRRVDVDAELAKSGRDYLLITSEPVTRAKRGRGYLYQIRTKSNADELRFRLESGPPAMTVTPKGSVIWSVPSSFADAHADVVLSVTTKSGVEQLQSFRILVE